MFDEEGNRTPVPRQPLSQKTQPAETVTLLNPLIVSTQIPIGTPINQTQLVAIKPGRGHVQAGALFRK